MNEDKWEREQRLLDGAAPHEYISYHIGINSKPILSELRFIKWLLVCILIMLITFANNYLPAGWWYAGWWS